MQSFWTPIISLIIVILIFLMFYIELSSNFGIKKINNSKNDSESEDENIEQNEIKKDVEKNTKDDKTEIIKIFNEDTRTNVEKLESAKAFLISDMGKINIVQSCIIEYQYVFTISAPGGFLSRIILEKTKDGYRKVINYSVNLKEDRI